MDMPIDLHRRHLALLRAVASGTAQVTCSAAPDLCIDGRWCSDHGAAGDLTRAGLLACGVGPVGALVPAALTATGQAVLAGAA